MSVHSAGPPALPRPLDELQLRARLATFRRRRWRDVYAVLSWGTALIAANYWRTGADLLTHVLATLFLLLFASLLVVLFVRDRREAVNASASADATRAYLSAQFDRRIGGIRGSKAIRQVVKLVGLAGVALGILIVVKERALGNEWAGIHMFVTSVLWALMFTVHPIYEESVVLPRLVRERAELAA